MSTIDLPQPVLSTGETLRQAALGMRSILEATGNEEMVLRRPGAEATYRLGEGLTVVVDGEESAELPESVLDDERWEIQS